MQFVVLDTETTGLRAYFHECVSFAGIKLDRNLREIDRLVIKIRPLHPERADGQAIQINGYSPARWAGALTPDEAAPKIAEFMKDCTPVAHNWAFDRGFILALFKTAGRTDLKIMRRGIDTIALAIAAFGPYDMKSYSLESIGALLGWPRQKHRAEADAIMTVALFRLLYPNSIKTALKVQMIVLYAKIRGITNPYRSILGALVMFWGISWPI
jgi:DNA polymerase III alpha subunit (gram-positive type)